MLKVLDVPEDVGAGLCTTDPAGLANGLSACRLFAGRFIDALPGISLLPVDAMFNEAVAHDEGQLLDMTPFEILNEAAADAAAMYVQPITIRAPVDGSNSLPLLSRQSACIAILQ
jgi:hypothetical protein